ncbi:hypothetical protein M422DRAFT_34230 [Sphaerobolus stellatus SS14]|uniref:Uncharacterized protein n=1 Tax=Sphaerobolus stellatus (strain SS14) TaxID=990650 RepID=A0A0C9VGT8_SPHS4|nr:hypothetical protein M422DRAFT_34230 [Sphaerobolus stellatus SS14]
MHSIVTSRILLHIRRAGALQEAYSDIYDEEDIESQGQHFSTIVLGPSPSQGNEDYEA